MASRRQFETEENSGFNPASVPDGPTRFLSFTLGGQLYAVPAEAITEIVEYSEVRQLPGSPHFVMGYMPVRDRVVLVLDLRKKYQLPEIEPKFRACVLLLKLLWGGEQQILGIYVEEADDIFTLNQQQLRPVPNLKLAFNSEYLLGLYTQESSTEDKRAILVMNTAKLFDDSEWQQINDQVKA